MADTVDLKSIARKSIRVQVPSLAPEENHRVVIDCYKTLQSFTIHNSHQNKTNHISMGVFD